MEKIIFACIGAPGKKEIQALNLVRSIRTFAGGLSMSPIWILIPDGLGEFSIEGQAEFSNLNATMISFHIEESILNFPFAAKVFASASAESTAEGRTALLSWMDTDSIVIQEPVELLLQPEKQLGYRPVDHTLIGSTYVEPIDSFWEMIYNDCHVERDRIFPMTASADENVIRPYFNAGMLVVRPEVGLMQAWRDNFKRIYKTPHYEDFYQQNVLYEIFIHQAILAGTVLSTMEAAELQELPYLVNYPLHMHNDYPAKIRPAYLNELITCRYDMFFDDANWRGSIPIKEPLKSWFEALGSSLG